MMIFAVGATIVLLMVIVVLMLVVKNAGRLGINKIFHRKFIIGYLILLLIFLIIAEVMERNYEFEQLSIVEGEQYGFDVRNAVEKGLPIPQRLIATKRTHEVEENFSIPKFPDNAIILIERTTDKSNLIEETVYRPEMLVEFGGFDSRNYDGLGGTYYDVSDKIQVELPVWDSRSMYVPLQPSNTIHYTFYHDSNILTQFSEGRRIGYSYSSGSMSGTMTVHLRIPESIELHLPQSADEFENYRIEIL
ncbi:hypothetical protein ORD22_13140 [Sporosarcina sp. GW1-11]|uniref:hypothetical protein n=1 Tax=Sporosarcina sp. GW1-11 TaxID=2899126 RepID=UPI00294F2470|nr:hypothetical protein [Sporosarcina sp. GW1-11]MDV6379160.1 hypothetical protein [Sporosarcina sp. GW1-11]